MKLSDDIKAVTEQQHYSVIHDLYVEWSRKALYLEHELEALINYVKARNALGMCSDEDEVWDLIVEASRTFVLLSDELQKAIYDV